MPRSDAEIAKALRTLGDLTTGRMLCLPDSAELRLLNGPDLRVSITVAESLDIARRCGRLAQTSEEVMGIFGMSEEALDGLVQTGVLDGCLVTDYRLVGTFSRTQEVEVKGIKNNDKLVKFALLFEDARGRWLPDVIRNRSAYWQGKLELDDQEKWNRDAAEAFLKQSGMTATREG